MIIDLYLKDRRAISSFYLLNSVRVRFSVKKANRRGSFNNILKSGGRPANFGKPCPHLYNMVKVRGENDLFPKINPYSYLQNRDGHFVEIKGKCHP